MSADREDATRMSGAARATGEAQETGTTRSGGQANAVGDPQTVPQAGRVREREPAAVRIAVIEHEAGTDARRFGDWLESAGARLTVFRPYAQAGETGGRGSPARPGEASDVIAGRLPRPDEFDGLVVLGGSMGPADDEAHPWMPGARDLLASSASGEFPSFAICLGGELLSLAAGERVRTRPVPQIGLFTATRRAEAAADPVFARLPAEFPVYLWHGIEMDLPGGAVHLVDGTDSPIQAFRLGEAWGTQFHPESTGEQLRVWGALAGMNEFHGDRSLDDVVAEVTAAESDVAKVMAPLAGAFVAYVRERCGRPRR